jgi:glycine betaine/proline transport system substrate-binding protein
MIRKNEEGENKKEVSIFIPNWSEGIASTYLAKVALEA